MVAGWCIFRAPVARASFANSSARYCEASLDTDALKWRAFASRACRYWTPVPIGKKIAVRDRCATLPAGFEKGFTHGKRKNEGSPNSRSPRQISDECII